MHDHDRDHVGGSLRPKAARLEDPDSALQMRAALSGQLDAVTSHGVLGLQRAAGNAIPSTGAARRAAIAGPAALRMLQTRAGNAAVTAMLQRLVEAPAQCPAPPVAAIALAPDEDPRFRAVESNVGQVGAKARVHPPAGSKVTEAQEATQPPSNDVQSQAAAAQADVMGAQQPAILGKKAFVQRQRSAPPGKAAPRTLKAGDRLRVETSRESKVDRQFSGEFQVEMNGTLVLGLGQARFPVSVAGLTLQQAAERLARCLVDRQPLVHPTVSVTLYGATASATYKAPKTAAQIARESFMAYVADVDPTDPALARYVKWLDEHANTHDLGRVTPVQLWGWSQTDPNDRESPRDKQIARFRQFMLDQLKRDVAVKDPKEMSWRHETMNRFEEWFEKNQEARDFLKRSPGTEYGRIAAKVIIKETKEEVAQDLAKRLESKRNPPDPATSAERGAKLDEFLERSKKLWGYSARKYPYTIHLKKQRKDILFMGDPALQKVLDDVADAFVQWAYDHMMDSGFTKVDPQQVLDDLLGREDFRKRLDQAQLKPEQHEYFDADVDDDLDGRRFLASFGTSVFKGLAMIALVGAVVGAELITAGQATWLLVGLATTTGVESYMKRRDEIEAGDYDVPVLETALASLGDVVAVSQLIEGVTGERLGTGMPLTGQERSDELGEGLGNLLTIFRGSRAWRTGEAIGMRYRPSRRGEVPAGPNASNRDVPDMSAQIPAKPQPSARPGYKERLARRNLLPQLQMGFDAWMAHLRALNADVEIALGRATPRTIERSSASHLRGYLDQVKRGRDAAYMRERARDDPLRPVLAHNEAIPGADVWVHYETRVRAREIKHAIRLSDETGEPVHVFGDTASKVEYPGIDGTIGVKPRPMQLKEYEDPGASAGRARWTAETALEKARKHGYTQVEVYIDMPHRTVAEVKAAWETGPSAEPVRPGSSPTDQRPSLRRPVYQGDIIAKIRIKASDGVWQPPKSKARTGVKPPHLPQNDDDERRRPGNK